MALNPDLTAAAQAQLDALAASMRIVPPALPNDTLTMGDPVPLRVTPVVPAMEVAHLLTGLVDLRVLLDPVTSVQKSVQFGDSAPLKPVSSPAAGPGSTFEGITTTGDGQKILGPTTTGVLTGGTKAQPGNQGLFSQLAGMTGKLTGGVPLPVRTGFPVTTEVTWQLYETVAGTKRVLEVGKEYLAPHGTRGSTVDIVPLPRFTDVTAGRPNLDKVFATASVVLFAAGVRTEPVTLPPVPLTWPAVELLPLLRQLLTTRAPAGTLKPGQVTDVLCTGTGRSNVLSTTLERFGGTLDVGYRFVRGGSTAPADVLTVPTSGPLALGAPLAFAVRPVVQQTRDDSATQNVTLKVTATLRGLLGLDKDLPVELLSLDLVQLPLPLVPLLGELRQFDQTGGSEVDVAQQVQLVCRNPVTDNALTAVLRMFGGTLSVGYEFLRGGARAEEGTISVGSAGVLAPSQLLTFAMRPSVVQDNGNPGHDEVTLRVRATLDNLLGTGQRQQVDLLTLALRQKSLPLPAIAFGFGGINYGFESIKPSCYVFAAPGHPALGTVLVDADTGPEQRVQEVKDLVSGVLTGVAALRPVLDALGALFPNMLGASCLDNLDYLIGKAAKGLADSAFNWTVVDTSGELDDLQKRKAPAPINLAQGWGDYLSSIIMFGAPGVRTLSLFSDAHFVKDEVVLSVQPGQFCGSINNFDRLLSDTVSLAPGMSLKYDNKVSSFRWN